MDLEVSDDEDLELTSDDSEQNLILKTVCSQLPSPLLPLMTGISSHTTGWC